MLVFRGKLQSCTSLYRMTSATHCECSLLCTSLCISISFKVTQFWASQFKFVCMRLGNFVLLQILAAYDFVSMQARSVLTAALCTVDTL